MYGIHRIEKRGSSDVYGLQLEANRTVQEHLKGREFPGSDIDWTKTKDNVHLVKNDNWNKYINELFQEKNIKPRKNSVVLLDSIYTASSEFFEDKSLSEIIDYFKACLDFHEKTYGKYTINAVIHFDELKRGQEQGLKYGNIHLHVSSCPIIDNPDGTASLSARDLMGGRNDYRKRQDEFYEQVSSLWGLERGEIKDYGEIRKHINKMEFEAQEAKIKAEKAKTELNIRNRVKDACKAQNTPIEIINQTKENKLLKKPATVTIKATDLEQLQSQVSTSSDLKNGLAALEKLAKEAKDSLSIDENIINAERELTKANERYRKLEKQSQETLLALQNKISEQQTQLNNQYDYIKKLEDFINTVEKWMKTRKVYKEFKYFIESVFEREREIEYSEIERV